MRPHHRIAVALVLLIGLVALAVLAANASGIEPPPVPAPPSTTTTLKLGPVASTVTTLPTCAVVPPISLDPGLLVQGEQVSTVQTLLGLKADGVYGTQTATAVQSVTCPDLGLYAALQALSESSGDLTAQAQARIAAAQAAPKVAAQAAPSGNFDPSLQPCGGAYPPCWVAQRESHGDYNAFNATGCYSNGRSGCYGKWQFGWFWGGKLGLPEDLSQATPAQQDQAALELWNGGAGCSNWAAC